MKQNITTLLIPILVFFGCGSKTSVSFTADQMTASGEYLFEGPNTLQGAFLLSTNEISKELTIDETAIASIQPSILTVTISDDSIQSQIESFLVQVVSEELPLLTIGTISPLQVGSSQSLAVNKELDLLPYAKDPTSTLVVDSNITGDLDELLVSVDMKVMINY